MAQYGIISKSAYMFVPDKCYKWYGSTALLEVKMYVSPDVARKSCEIALLQKVKIAKKEGKF